MESTTSMTSKYMNFSPHLVNERNLALNNCPTKSGRSQIYRTYYLKMKDAYENYEEESEDEYYEEESSEDEDEDDEDYVESEEETDDEATDDEATDDEASEAEASEAEASEAEASEADASEAEDDEEASEADASEAESEAEDEEEEDKNEFGCAGCNYEWRDGYKNGWRDAMKYIAGKTYKEVPDTPGCSYCAIVCKTRKCGGKCGGTVRYCSINCQKQDWASGHKDKCGKL